MMTNSRKLRVVILGSRKTGKSAVTVRYLTRRYIGEYSSDSDFMYRHTIAIDDSATDVEILDTSNCQVSGCFLDHLRWGDAFVVVYSICDRKSFEEAQEILEEIGRERRKSSLLMASRPPTILLGNKRDLAEHWRIVAVDDGHETSLRFGCQFYEVSAADNYVGVSLAFQSLFRELKSSVIQPLHSANNRTLPTIRRCKSGAAITVSKMIGMVFGKNATIKVRGAKKRPSLSI